MTVQLHVLTRPNDELALQVIERQRRLPEAQVLVVDLTQPNPDYDALLERIFAADSVAVW